MKLLLAAVIIAVTPPAAPAPPLSDLIKPPSIENMTPRPTFAQECCKRCSKGKPCGDSCISRKKQCQKGKGCAC